MTAYRLLRLGLGVALIVLLIGVVAAYFNITGAFEIIWAALIAIAVQTAAIATIARRVPHRQNPNQQQGRVGAP